jgi:flagellar P-ring protein FlgI
MMKHCMDARSGNRRRTAASWRMICLMFAAIVALGATRAHATGVQDLVRIKGLERNVVQGMGIVVGLNGTGDTGKDSLVTARAYAEFFKNLENQVVNPVELIKADTYAIVNVTLEIPASGAREGDQYDVHVDTLYNARSLTGGRLIVSILYLPVPIRMRGAPVAQANGVIEIQGTNPRSGIIRGGGQMLRDLHTNPVSQDGSMNLVLRDQYAGYPNATTIAGAINDEFAVDGHSDVASVIDSKNVRIMLPEADRRQPAEFIATMLTIAVDPTLIQNEARIVINGKQGIILVTGNVEVGPVGIAHRGLTITTIMPPPAPTQAQPIVETTRWAGLDTTDRNSRGSTRLVDLLKAFEQIKVPVDDQIAIIYELKKTGALHAEIVDE